MHPIKHFKTITYHKWQVLKGCFAVGLYWRGLCHDLSKYSPSEFFIGAKYYQGNRSPIDACKEEPTLVFALIKQGNYEAVEELINENMINVNIVDSVGNDVVTRLLKAQQYDLVCQLMKKRNWDVNHQNADGNTFAHVLANDDSLFTVKIAEQLIKKKNYIKILCRYLFR